MVRKLTEEERKKLISRLEKRTEEHHTLIGKLRTAEELGEEEFKWLKQFVMDTERNPSAFSNAMLFGVALFAMLAADFVEPSQGFSFLHVVALVIVALIGIRFTFMGYSKK